MIKILITEQISKKAVSLLEDNGFVIKWLDGCAIEDAIMDCDVVIVRRQQITKELINCSSKLKLIAKHGVGVDSIDIEEANNKGINVINTPGINSTSVAEHTMMLILSCAKKLNIELSEYKKGNYNIKNNLNIVELEGKKLGLIGFGNVAKKVAMMASNGFNMSVYYFDPFINNIDDAQFIKLDKMNDLLTISDFVSIHIPGNEENRQLIDINKLKMMKKSSYIINTSRGNIINQNDLLYALNNNLIAGAGLDVCDPEPAAFDSAILNNEKVIITPHCGAASNEVMEKTGIEIAKQIIDYFNN